MFSLEKCFLQNLRYKAVLAVLFYMAYSMIGTNFTGIEQVRLTNTNYHLIGSKISLVYGFEIKCNILNSKQTH